MISMNKQTIISNLDYVKLLVLYKQTAGIQEFEIEEIPFLARWIRWNNENIENLNILKSQTDNLGYLKSISKEIKWEKKQLKQHEARLDNILRRIPNDMADNTPVLKGLNWGQIKLKHGIDEL